MSRPGEDQPELVRSEREHNQVAAQRIAASEAGRCLPALRQAIADAHLGQQVRHMAAYAGDTEVETELTQALRELAQAAAS